MNLKSILSECWTGYKQVGMKNKGGRQVPNCVPESVTESSIDESLYRVAGRPVTLIKGKKSNGTDWKVKFENGKETSLSDVIALIKPFPKDIKINESELKGYLAADVVDDIVKSIGSKFVSGEIKNAPNRNYIYLKLTDIKFGNDVVKMLKSQFGIDAKVDTTFGNQPSVSFPSNKVIKEAQAVSGGKVHKLITGKNLKFKGKSYNQIEFETLGVDNNNGTIRLKIIAPKEIFGNEMSLDFRTIRRGPFFKTDMSNQLGEGLYYVGYNKGRGQGTGVFKDSYSSYKDAKKEVEKIEKQRGGSYQQIAYYVADKDGNFVRESVNEWKLQLDLGKVNPLEFEKWADSSLQKKHKIKVSGSNKNWTIVGKGNDDRMGSSADWISQLLGKAWTINKIKVVQKESVNEISSNVPKIFVKTAAVEKKIKELMADRKRAVVPYNSETDPAKKEKLKQILIKLTSQIKGYEKNLIQLRDMEEEYIQQMNANAELEVESKN